MRSTASRSRSRHGTLTALVGPDGAGKTTLIRLSPGSDARRRRQLDGAGHRRRGAIRRQVQDRIGYMPQRFGLYEDLSVQENLDLYADLHGVIGADERRERYPAPDGDDRPRAVHASGWPASCRAA